MKNYWLDLRKFKIGDMVQLICDSISLRTMTVSNFDGEFYYCVWFDAEGFLCYDKYKECWLELADDYLGERI